MSSLALQLFVNLNKLIQPHACTGLGSHYAKRLVDRVRSEHPQLLSCNDPSNAHTAALSAFALGIGLRELRQEGADRQVVEGVALILKTALDRADDGLDELPPDEVHLLLRAHEEYKTHLGVRAEPVARSRTGGVRGAVDILPLATTSEIALRTSSWKDPGSVQAPPLQATSIDVDQPISLPEIPQALTGEMSFASQPTFAQPSVSEASTETGQDEQEKSEDMWQATGMPAREGRTVDNATPIPSYAGGMPTLHPVRQDRNAEREFSDPAELTPESVESLLARKRMQQALQRQSIPVHMAWEGPAQVRNPAPLRGSVLEESEWSRPSESASTYLHSESASDSSLISMGKKKKAAIPVIAWAAPALLLFPPAGLFYGGVLWNRREYGQSLFSLSLSLAGTVGLAAAWIQWG